MITYKTASIANGASITAGLDVDGYTLVGIITPSAWTAADLTFQAGYRTATDDTVTYADVYDADGTELVAQADTSRYIAISPLALVGAKHLKVRSGTAAAAVNQGAARTLILVLERQA